jgi:hypothetical protein
MPDLSPAAQAAIDAAWKGVPSGLRNPYVVRCEQIAASYRALAARINGAEEIRQDVLDIAAELVAEAADVEAHQ